MVKGDFKPFLDRIEPRYPRLFVTISGSHLYGFPSVDSDYDLRGSFARPTRELLGLGVFSDTIEHMDDGPNPADIVLHEAAKYARLLLKNNGYVLEQILSPLVVETTPWHAELCTIAPQCVNVRSLGHYLGFSAQQIALMRRRPDKEVKILLYIFRVLMTGLYLARTGTVEPNIVVLNEHFRLPFIDDLIAEKVAREEGALAGERGLAFFTREYEKLLTQLEAAKTSSRLAPVPDPQAARRLEDWLVRLRMHSLASEASLNSKVLCID